MKRLNRSATGSCKNHRKTARKIVKLSNCLFFSAFSAENTQCVYPKSLQTWNVVLVGMLFISIFNYR